MCDNGGSTEQLEVDYQKRVGDCMCVCLKEMRAMPVCDYTVKGGNTLDLETCLTAAVPRRDHGGTAGRQRSGCPLGLASSRSAVQTAGREGHL